MMDDICAHIVDIVANSVTAGASSIRIAIEDDKKLDLRTLRIIDNGKGMDEETAARVVDPFFSTKTGRKVGLGIPLLKGTAETCGGAFSIVTGAGQGTDISVSFQLSHPDLPPLGNLKDTFLMLTVSNPDTDFSFVYKNGDKIFILDIKEVRAELGGVPINHPEVITFLKNYLDRYLSNYLDDGM